MHFLNNLHRLYGKLFGILLCEVRYVVLFAQESKLSVYDLWLIVICLYNRVILDDFIPEFCNFEVGHSRILQFSLFHALFANYVYHHMGTDADAMLTPS